MGAKKYHVNDEFEVTPCRATSGRCPFGGISGNERHFDTKEEALADAEKRTEALVEKEGAPKRARYVEVISQKLTEAAQADQSSSIFSRFAIELPEPGTSQSYAHAPAVQLSDQAKLWVEASVRDFHDRNYATLFELSRNGISNSDLSEVFGDQIIGGTAFDESIAQMRNHGLPDNARLLKRLKKSFERHPISSIGEKVVIDRSSGIINIR